MFNRRLGAALSLAILGLVASAHAADLPTGCFERSYSAKHLRENPRQTIRRLTLVIEKSRYGYPQIDFGLNVWVRGHSQIWRAGGQCETVIDAWSCKPDTDGAPELTLMADGKKLRVLNDKSVQLFDDKTGPDLNTRYLRPPGDAAFILNRAPHSACKT
jgi:hypothetical protein